MFYRIRQFWHNVTAVALPDHARTEVETVLNGEENRLFQRFSDSDQRHAYQVYKILLVNGHTNPDLLVAALLHDIGKLQMPLSVISRSIVVLVGKMAPKLSAMWGQGEGRGWQRPFIAKAQHPEWGAQMATSAGSTPLTIELIRRHQDPLPAHDKTVADQLLRLLQWADDQN